MKFPGIKREFLVLVATTVFIVWLYGRRIYHYVQETNIAQSLRRKPAVDQDTVSIKDPLILKILKDLRKPAVDTDFGCIFKGNFTNSATWQFDFGEMSKRRFGRSYVEQASYDPNGRNGDFFNPVEFDKDSVVLFEDNGAGIFQRFYLYHCPTNEVIFEVDGEDVFAVPVVPKNGVTYPFPKPLMRLNDQQPWSGFYISHPISYNKRLRIRTRWSGSEKWNSETAWEHMRICHAQNTKCNIPIYYGVTLNKLAYGGTISTHFKDYISKDNVSPKAKHMREMTTALLKMAEEPEKYAPGLGSSCELSCQRVEPGENVVIYRNGKYAQVLQSIRLRVYDIMNGIAVTSENWRRVLITMQWDGKRPQVKEIPLGAILNVGLDFIREIKSLTTGLRVQSCDVKGGDASKIQKEDWTAYLYYEMPFWKSALITVKIPPGFKPAVICSQFYTKVMIYEEYHPRTTGYFSAQLNQEEYDYLHHKDLVHLSNQWGHVVALNLFMRNTNAASTMENDIMIETNGAVAPMVYGSGLEDFFHYLSDFRSHRNSSAPFGGVPYYYLVGYYIYRASKSFRHNTLDPILFANGIRIYYESSSDQTTQPPNRTFTKSSSDFNQTISPNSMYSVVLYYGNKGSGGVYTDKLNYHDAKGLSSRIRFSPRNVKSFPIHSMFESQPGWYLDRIVVSMEPGQSAVHALKISSNNVGVILRREYRTMVPNQKANVKIDGKDAGLWFCPQRAFAEEYSLRLHDHLLPANQTAGKNTIEVTLTAITRWETVSIEVLSIVLGD